MEWRPIETAPKDGAKILLFEDGCVYLGAYNTNPDETVQDGHWLSFCGQPVVWSTMPTHWMGYEPPKEEDLTMGKVTVRAEVTASQEGRHFCNLTIDADELRAALGIGQDTIKSPPEKEEWPRVGDNYWLIDDEGDVFMRRWDNDKVDRGRQRFNNIYRTREAAERAVAKQKALVRYRGMPGRVPTPPFHVDGTNYGHYFAYKTQSRGWMVGWAAGDHQGTIFFDTEANCQAAIDAMGKDMDLLLDGDG